MAVSVLTCLTNDHFMVLAHRPFAFGAGEGNFSLSGSWTKAASLPLGFSFLS